MGGYEELVTGYVGGWMGGSINVEVGVVPGVMITAVYSKAMNRVEAREGTAPRSPERPSPVCCPQ